jgi:pimeloyl-ACP methyl ester carboxylesterase
MASSVQISRVDADGVNVFYRHAGSAGAPVILLLHGFPSSSFQFRKLIPLLATKYRVVAPDLPGFGFTTVPAERKYKYTFASFAKTISAFLDVLNIKSFAVYIFDYGAPTALRIALERPNDITAIIAQNGNAYVEGFGKDIWAPIEKYWASSSSADREAVRKAMLNYDITKFQYVYGTPKEKLGEVGPETYTLDWALMSNPEQQEIQLDIFYDYGTNVPLYPQFQEYFRNSKVPILVTWGKHDPIFIWPGGEAYKRDSPNAEIHMLDAGHFAVESHTEEIANYILKFFEKNGI